MPRKPEKIIEPINAPFEEVVRAVVSPKKSEVAEPEPEEFEKIICDEGKLDFGGVTVPCYVTESKKRLLSARGMQEVLRVVEETTVSGQQVTGAALVRFLAQKSLKPLFLLISDRCLLEPIKAKYGNQIITGYRAELLPEICEVMLHGRREGLLVGSRQEIVAAQCEIVLASLAKVGIIALVDEATGYLSRAEKERNEYRELFKEFVRESAKQYESEFPEELYDVFYRIYGYPKTQKGRPLFFAKATRKYVYEPLARSSGMILEMLDERNPVEISISGKRRRKYKLFQFLEDVGISALRAHLWKLVGIGEASRGKAEFDRNFERVFGAQLEFPYLDEEN